MTLKTLSAAICLSLVTASAHAATFSNTTAIDLPGSGTQGPASEFPSNIFVKTSGTITNVKVSLFGVSHTFSDDIFLALVGPDGTSVVLMSDAGGGRDLVNNDLTFSDDAAASIPNGSSGFDVGAGVFQVSQFGDVETLPAPAPTFSFGTNLSAFDGKDSLGAWSLFAFDDQGGDTGQIAGGWLLNVDVAPVPLPASLPLLLAGLGAVGMMLRRQRG